MDTAITLDSTQVLSISAARIEDTVAKAYRLARRNGELVLQGCFFWRKGLNVGYDWRDIPIVDLDSPNELESNDD